MATSGGSSTALADAYNHQIRPLLDAIDRLRELKVMQQGIQLPTIVVVGDQSSGKSSVLESLAGISLPRGEGICTRVPLIMRLQNKPFLSKPELFLDYKNKMVSTSEASITDAINAATDEIAGDGKGICRTPLTLIVEKKGVPDLTMIDLPGITRVAVHDQPKDIYEQISSIIMEHIAPKESIILNVLSASVDFSTCESIRMSQQVDKTGERTLAVVTKVDQSPEGLLEKVTTDAVNIGLGYVCVRNRVGDESYEKARAAEARLFESHPKLSKIDKSIVGIPVLSQKLMQIQAAGIAKCLPDIVRKINEKLNNNVADLDQMPRSLESVGDAVRAFMHMVSSAKEYLRDTLIRGEYDESDKAEMHGRARLAEMLSKYSHALPSECPTSEEEFLMDEIKVLEDSKGIGLPNFLPRDAFHRLLQRKVKLISHVPHDFIIDVWRYLKQVLLKVMLKYCDNYPQLQSSTRRAALNIIERMKKRSLQFVKEIIEMETVADYTASPDYMKAWYDLMQQQEQFMDVIHKPEKGTMINLKGFGVVDVGHLIQYAAIVEQAYDLRVRLTSYWKIVVLRLIDGLALHILHSVKILVEHELEVEMVNEIVGSKAAGIEKMLEESPASAEKRERLRKSIEVLQESKDVVANIMDRISSAAD